MKNLVLRSFYIVLALSSLLLACRSEDVRPKDSIEILSGNNQIGIQGEFITEPVVIKVNSTRPYDQLALQMPRGGGMLVGDNYDVETLAYLLDENYEARVYFSLECQTGTQTFNISIRDIGCSMDHPCPSIASVEAQAQVVASDSDWKRLCGFPRGGRIQAHNGFAYAFNTRDIRVQESELLRSMDFRRWEPVETIDDRITDFDILNDGTFIAITSQEVLFGTDGASWQAKQTGLPGPDEFLYPSQLLAEDTVIFVNYTSTDIDYTANWYRSRDKGQSWELLIAPLADYPIVRAENGSLFGLSTEFSDSIFQSNDSGNSWESLKFNGTIEGRIQEIHPDENGDLYILATQSGFASNVPSAKLYHLDTETFILTEEALPTALEYISRLQTYDGILYLLSGQNLYKKSSSWELIEGPNPVYPSIEGVFFQAAFDYLYVVEEGKYILSSYFGSTYSNL
ncbi:MAG: hypothetical protein HRT61_14625 [Ekhidna sp.]|nr:hypothetical protein [Ekhidna sp.]